jgi:cysteine desulfurase / selenocysteine lyase
VGRDWIRQHEHTLAAYAYDQLSQIEGLRILGPGPDQRAGLVAFTLQHVHPHDIAALLDNEGIAIRAGHHCAQPIHTRYDIAASARASFYLYNTQEEVDQLVIALEKAVELFGF